LCHFSEIPKPRFDGKQWKNDVLRYKKEFVRGDFCEDEPHDWQIDTIINPEILPFLIQTYPVPCSIFDMDYQTGERARAFQNLLEHFDHNQQLFLANHPILEVNEEQFLANIDGDIENIPNILPAPDNIQEHFFDGEDPEWDAEPQW
jgi:hypothetical protein